MRISSTLFLATALASTLAACGAHGPKSAGMTATEPATSPHDMQRQTPNGEITALSQEISDWRVQLGMAPLPGDEAVDTAGVQPVPAPMSDDHVEAIEDPTCRDVCTIAASICENAERICRIAEEDLPGDDWAAGKCNEAKASCTEARENCDACAGEPG